MQVLAAVAVLLASINIFGGFAVTRRMLAMFARGAAGRCCIDERAIDVGIREGRFRCEHEDRSRACLRPRAC